MHQLVYLSSAVIKFTNEELKSLLQKARENNSALDVTGMLLYIDGNFIQVLEGEKNIVLKLFDKISLNSRHHGIISIIEKTVSERTFPDWTMGFESLTMEKASELSGYKNLKDDFFKLENFKNAEHPAIKLLKNFYKNNARS